MREPFVTVTAGGRNLTDTWGPLLLEVSVTDERGTEADKFSATLDDRNGQCAYPDTGATVTVRGGFRGEGDAVVGEFVVDAVRLEGWPQKIVIQGQSVDAKKPAAKERRSETYKRQDTPTLGDIARKIAGRNGWSAAVAERLGAIAVTETEHQAEESDTAFLNRLFGRHDGLIKVTQGRLLVLPRGSMQTASGASVPPLVIRPALNLLSYRVSWSEKPTAAKVEARWFDRLKAEPQKLEVDVGKGDSDAVVKLPEPFATEEEAREAADARAREIKRGDGSATFEIVGDPRAGAERPVRVEGVRSGVNGEWVPTRVEHVWGRGYVTRLECETPGSDSREEDGE